MRDVLLWMEQGQTGSSSIFTEDGEIIISYSPIRGTRWSLGIQSPRSGFTSELDQAITISVGIIIAFFLLLSAGLLILFRALLTRPLHAITKNARELAVGECESRLPQTLIRRNDEIGQLGTAFATMSDTIIQLVGDIGRLTDDARAGSLHDRAALELHQGDYRLILEGINATLDAFTAHLVPDVGGYRLL